MAEQIVFSINLQTGQPIKTLGELKKNTKDLRKELDQTKIGTQRFNELRSAITRNRTAIRNFNRQINQSQPIARRFAQGIIASFKQIGVAALAAFSVRAVINFARESLKAFDVQQKAEKALLVALKDRQDIQKNLIKQAQELQKVTLFGDEETIAAQTQLATLGLTEDQIVQLIPLVQDLATVQGKGLEKATKTLTNTLATGATTLERYGVELESTNTLSENFDKTVQGLTESISGQAQQAAQAGLGSFVQLNNTIGDIQESVGGLLAQALTPFVGAMKNVADSVSDFLAQPVDIELQKQRSEFNLLTNRLKDTNITQDERNRLIEKAQRIAPEFLAGLDTESVTLQQIETSSKEVNKQFEQRIQLTIKQAQVDAKLEEINDRVRIASEQRSKAAAELAESQDQSNETTDVTTAKTFDFLASIVGVVDVFDVFTKSSAVARNELANQLENGVIPATEEYEKLKDELAELTVNQDTNTQSTANNTQSQEDNEKAIKARIKALSDLAKEQINAVKESIAAQREEESVEDEFFDERKKKRDQEISDQMARFETSKILAEDDLTAQADILEQQKQLELANFKGTRDEKALLEADFNARIKKLRAEAAQEDIQLSQETAQAENELLLARVQAAGQVAGAIASITEEGTAASKAAFALQKGLAVAEVIINTIRANAAAALPPPFGVGPAALPFVIAANNVRAAASIATITAQAIKKFKDGGLVEGASHAQGGVKFAVGGQVNELEGGEAVINKRSTAMFKPILSAINQAGGGKKFQDGGVSGVPSLSAPNTDLADLLGAVRRIDIAPTVSVEEINRVNTRVTEINNRGEL